MCSFNYSCKVSYFDHGRWLIFLIKSFVFLKTISHLASCFACAWLVKITFYVITYCLIKIPLDSSTEKYEVIMSCLNLVMECRLQRRVQINARTIWARIVTPVLFSRQAHRRRTSFQSGWNKDSERLDVFFVFEKCYKSWKQSHWSSF